MEEKIIEQENEEMASEPYNEAEETTEQEGVDLDEEVSDYSEDVALLSEIFPWLDDEINVTDNERYVQLRDLGLSAKEAFLAIGAAVRKPDNRSHLISSVPKSAAAPRSQMTRSELECARSIFEGMDELEIKRLYKKVTK